MKINNRRYLGNKFKLLPFIKDVVNKECNNIETVADIFAGTGAVASAFFDKKLITNDIMYSNYICHVAWFKKEKFSEVKVKNIIGEYNNLSVTTDNYMSENFADTYFSLDDCRKIGYIREDIEKKYNNEEINSKERALLVTSLLYAMDKIANTCGHYDAYRKNGIYNKHLEMTFPEINVKCNNNNMCYNKDTNTLVNDIEADLVYIDPPYNSRQYCDAYHLLENVAKWEKPKVFGVAKKMDRTNLKSEYCTQRATKTFENLISNIKAKYILLSYNNMEKKGDNRSNAKISDEDIIRILKKKGNVKIFSEKYKAFNAGKSNIEGNEERLFLCECFKAEKKIIPSAINYTGGKYKLLSQIMKYFPTDIDNAIDLFCGGCNVGINLSCNKVVFNDKNKHLIGLFNTFERLDEKYIFDTIFDNIKKYDLSLVAEKGYEFYGCDSSSGLGKYNKKGYMNLRKDFNKKSVKDDDYYILLYLLMVYSFNNQLRFNSKGEFNLPVGKRDFNLKMQNKLKNFLHRIKSGDYTFINKDFREVLIDKIDAKSFVYVDPPYLITTATYNESSGWTEDDEKDLLLLLEKLDRKNIKFALSNVLECKGKENSILKEWINNNNKFKTIFLNYSYANSNYHKKDKESTTKEVLIINY
ncbi:Dam family site-specific DNA-(adenine-N6)-methyltransferase [uncultured Megamonas sp.]|uniref:Dam family site-specific DNA-(adenine-N6)-methyltransferase n=1 Tax=uncultured Megamonas sp. TaxID=286140 RepID=UPI0025D8350E|nr:Dam family site-specific DNA-(adenine-N6)-methyltransferase [uncultured Megamonas sp.]